jgi:para-aminobenzoate synthetase / 4-amino-4-deoxychorismate lyase
MTHSALIQDTHAGGWWEFLDPLAIVRAEYLEEVLPALQEVERRVEQEGLWAVGYVAYEAGPAFDPGIAARAKGETPLLWMGLYRPPQLIRSPAPAPDERIPHYQWHPSVDKAAYGRAITRIRELIANGDTYQVNYTLRLRAPAEEDPFALFLRMVHANDPAHAAYLDCGRFVVCSASPELFFSLDQGLLTSRPMKGTAGRGLWPAQDAAKAGELEKSLKNRAENVMIVDMVRNDMGRIAQVGSVQATRLFELERYPTVWQLTSTVSARCDAPLGEIFRALFPPASITGAPKARASEIIAELETTPRGVYTGCIGYIAPGRRMKFNVAIRTATLYRETHSVEYGVGGGIVWDSTTQAEYQECLLKARIVTDTPPPFSLLETLLWEPDCGWFLLDAHLTRLSASANYLGARVDLPLVRVRLDTLARDFDRTPQRVRLLVARDGGISCEAAPLVTSSEPVRLRIGAAPIDRANPFLYNKTTYRKIYDEAKASQPDCDDVILWNTSSQVTETTIANLVVDLDDRTLTPPIECGLLPGIFRAHLLACGEIEEAIITLEDLRRATRIRVINSVRRWREAELVDSA